MKRIWFLIKSLLLILAVFASFHASEQAQLRFTSVSIRYNQPLPVEFASTAKLQMQKEGSVNLTFWAEQSVHASSMVRNAEAQQILFDGEAMLACPAQYVYGRFPVTAGECAVDTALAETLWGAQNVVGLEVSVSENTYTVAGVFSGSDGVLLSPEKADWTAAELHSIPSGADGWKYGRDYAMQLGLPQPDQVLWGSGFAWISCVLPWLPLLFCGCSGLFYALRQLWHRSHAALAFALTSLAFAFVLLLPLILAGLPAWLIPTKWSDFSFWAQFYDSLAARFRDFLSLSPKSIDIARKTYLLQTILYSAVFQLLSASLFRRDIRRYWYYD